MRGSLDHPRGGERLRDGFSAVQNLRVEHGVGRAGDRQKPLHGRRAPPGDVERDSRVGVSPHQIRRRRPSHRRIGGAGVEFLDAVEHGARHGRGRDARERRRRVWRRRRRRRRHYSSSSSSSSFFFLRFFNNFPLFFFPQKKIPLKFRVSQP